MTGVHEELIEVNSVPWQVRHIDLNLSWIGRDVVIVVVPDENRNFVFTAGGYGVHVGSVYDTLVQDTIQGSRSGTFDLRPVAAQHSQHTEYIQHGLIDAIGSQFAKSSKVWLVLRLEPPPTTALHIHSAFA